MVVAVVTLVGWLVKRAVSCAPSFGGLFHYLVKRLATCVAREEPIEKAVSWLIVRVTVWFICINTERKKVVDIHGWVTGPRISQEIFSSKVNNQREYTSLCMVA